MLHQPIATINGIGIVTVEHDGELFQPARCLRMARNNKPGESCPETRPDHLLPRYSITPYWKEARRREALFRDIEKLTTRIERLLLDFEQMSLYSPRGLGRCAYSWENELSDKVWNAFYSLDETIRSALSDFRKSAFSPSWDLFEYFGLCDVEYIESLETEARRLRMFEIRQDFEAAIARQFFPDDIFPDNLPF